MDQQPTPFVPGTNVQHAWDSTSLGWLKECPRKYQYHMLEGWVGRGESVHLKFGILYHEALQNYELFRHNGLDHDEAVRDVVREILTRTWGPEGPWRAMEDLSSDDKTSLKNREYLVRTVV